MTRNKVGKHFGTKPVGFFLFFLFFFLSTLIVYVAITAADRFFKQIRVDNEKN